MIDFFCSRCGTPLEIEPVYAGGKVRCGHCSTLVRAPEVPLAVALVPAESDADALADPVVLSYVGRVARQRTFTLEVERMAERLNHIDTTVEPTDDSMTNCPVCGSTIARFLRKCPFCRHML